MAHPLHFPPFFRITTCPPIMTILIYSFLLILTIYAYTNTCASKFLSIRTLSLLQQQHKCIFITLAGTSHASMAKQHFGRRVRTKGRASSTKQRSVTSDSHERRLDTQLLLDEQEITCQERMKTHSEEYEKKQKVLDDSIERRNTLRSKTSSSSECSTIVVPLSVVSLVSKSSNSTLAPMPSSVDSHSFSLSSLSCGTDSDSDDLVKRLKVQTQNKDYAIRNQTIRQAALRKENEDVKKKALLLENKCKLEKDQKETAWGAQDKMKARASDAHYGAKELFRDNKKLRMEAENKTKEVESFKNYVIPDVEKQLIKKHQKQIPTTKRIIM